MTQNSNLQTFKTTQSTFRFDIIHVLSTLFSSLEEIFIGWESKVDFSGLPFRFVNLTKLEFEQRENLPQVALI